MNSFKSVSVELDFKELNIIKHGIVSLISKNTEDIRNATTDSMEERAVNDVVDNKLVLDRIVGVLDQFYMNKKEKADG